MTTCWFAGLTTLDAIHRVDRLPGANEKITANAQHVAAGGPAANAAVTAAALGVRATLITALGAGPAAGLARADLEAQQVRILDAARTHDLSISSVIVGPGGDRAVVSTDAGSPDLGDPDLTALDGVDAALLDGHHPRLQRAVLAAVTARGGAVVLDAGRWRPIFAELIPHADVVACSADFALPTLPGVAHEQLAAAILAQGAGAVVITDGGGPVRWYEGSTSGLLPVPSVPVRDTLGAGDAFHGALTVALARGESLPGACAEGISVASTRVQFPGPRSYLAEL